MGDYVLCYPEALKKIKELNLGAEEGKAVYSSGSIKLQQMYGYSLNFDGVDDYVHVGNVGQFNAITVAAWVKLDKLVDSWERIVTSRWGYEGGFLLYRTFHPNEAAGWLWGVSQSEGSYNTINSYVVPEVDAWYFLTGTYNSTGHIAIYVNGEKKNEEDWNPLTIDATSVDISGGGATSVFDGIIDEVMIFNRALSDSEIEELYKSGTGSGAITNGLVLWHHYGRKSATDLSGHGNNGTIHGATWVIEENSPNSRWRKISDFDYFEKTETYKSEWGWYKFPRNPIRVQISQKMWNKYYPLPFEDKGLVITMGMDTSDLVLLVYLKSEEEYQELEQILKLCRAWNGNTAFGRQMSSYEFETAPLILFLGGKKDNNGHYLYLPVYVDSWTKTKDATVSPELIEVRIAFKDVHPHSYSTESVRKKYSGNLIFNPSFEYNSDVVLENASNGNAIGAPSLGWTVNGGSPESGTVKVGFKEFEGKICSWIKVINAQNSVNLYPGFRMPSWLNIPCNEGDKFKIGCRVYVKSLSGNGTSFNIYRHFRDEDYGIISAGSTSTTTTGQWVTLEEEWTAPEGSKWLHIGWYFFVPANETISGEAYISDVWCYKEGDGTEENISMTNNGNAPTEPAFVKIRGKTETLILDQAQWSSNNASGLGNDGTTYYDQVAQSFRPTKSELSRISVKIQKFGSPDDITVYIKEDSGGNPTGKTIAHTYLSKDDVTGNSNWRHVDIPCRLNAGQTYWLVLETSDAGGGNYYAWSHWSSGCYPEGEGKWHPSGGNWSGDGRDHCFMTFYHRNTKNLSLYTEKDKETKFELGSNWLGQSQNVDDGNYVSIYGSYHRGFTFKPQDDKLSKIVLRLTKSSSGAGNLRIRLYEYDTSQDKPIGNALKTVYVAPAEVSADGRTDLHIPFEVENLNLTKYYAIICDSPNSNSNAYFRLYQYKNQSAGDITFGRFIKSDDGANWTEDNTILVPAKIYHPLFPCELIQDQEIIIYRHGGGKFRWAMGEERSEMELSTMDYQGNDKAWTLWKWENTNVDSYRATGSGAWYLSLNHDDDAIYYKLEFPFLVKNFKGVLSTHNSSETTSILYYSKDGENWEKWYVQKDSGDISNIQLNKISNFNSNKIYIKFKRLFGSGGARLDGLYIEGDLNVGSAMLPIIEQGVNRLVATHDETSSYKSEIELRFLERY